MRKAWLDMAILFGVGMVLRKIFFQGFILGDDPNHFHLAYNMVTYGPTWRDQLELRFFGWIGSGLGMKIAGMGESGFFIPMMMASALIPPLGYLAMLWKGYRRPEAFWTGLFIASSPFEIMIGTLCANDIFLSFFLALTFVFLFWSRNRTWQGILLGFSFWAACYAKFWAIYLAPCFALFLWHEFKDGRLLNNPIRSMIISSVMLQGGTLLFWKIKMGSFFPFAGVFPTTYRVFPQDLIRCFRIWPDNILHGSEFGTTLFGWVPYIAAFGLLLKLVGICCRPKRWRWDDLDSLLCAYAFGFALLLNFVPHSFIFDHYYSFPRIFRYLSPISFPLSFLAAKNILDIGKNIDLPYKMAIGCLLILLNVQQAAEATHPGRAYRHALMNLLQELETTDAPRIVVDTWPGWLLRIPYAKNIRKGLQVTVAPAGVEQAQDHEKWLQQMEGTWEPGTLLLTGFSSYVYYGCGTCGYQLRFFKNGLGPRWKYVKGLGYLDYEKPPETVNLYRLTPS